MPETVTAARAAQLVGVSEKTMLRWLAAGKVKGAKVSPLGEAARWEVPVGALDAVRRSPRPSNDLAAVVEELRATIERLEARLDALEARGEGQQAALPALDVQSLLGHYEPSESPRRRVKTQVDVTDDLDAPADWVAVPSYVRDLHGVPLRTLDYYESLSRLSVTHDQRYRERPRVFATNWLTPEQQDEFHRAFHDRLGDPCPHCGWSAARELVPTVRRMSASDT